MRLPFAVDDALLQGAPGMLLAAVAPLGVEAASVRLGALGRSAQAQLDGFRARVLRADAPTRQRHMYVTAWRSAELAEVPSAPVLVVSDVDVSHGGCERVSSRASRGELTTSLAGGKWAGVAAAVSTHRAAPARDPLRALEVGLVLVQIQASSALTPKVWLITMDAHMVGHSPAHAGPWGLARSARAEASPPLLCIDAPVATALSRALSFTEPEAVLRAGEQLVPRLRTAQTVFAGRPWPIAPTYEKASGDHIVSGGTGGLGLLTGRWLAQRGARRLFLASRSGALARHTASEWEAVCMTDAVTSLVQCDTCERAHIRRLVALVPILDGVWHAAGVLADALLSNQTAGTLGRSYAPKAHGAQSLHGSILSPSSTCVLFSSVMALLGGAGQANYSAANMCLDALASYRRARSQVATSVQWGAWAEVGMAARGAASERFASMEAAAGFGDGLLVCLIILHSFLWYAHASL